MAVMIRLAMLAMALHSAPAAPIAAPGWSVHPAQTFNQSTTAKVRFGW